MNNGWIKIHRKLLDNPIYNDPHLLHLFIHCVLKANHKEQEFLFNNELMKVKRGQFITGRFQLGKELNQNPSSIYKRLKILEKLEILNIKSNNKFSMITVLKYNTYQDEVTTKEQQKEQQSNNKVTTKEQQNNTNKNDKKEENDNNEKKEAFAVEKTQPLDFVDSIILLFQNCYHYNKGIEYISVGKGKNKFNYKDRNAAGSLLKYIKSKYPGEDSETTLRRFESLFVKCFSINDVWLKNNMTLDTIFNKLNNIILYGQNGNKEPGTNSRKDFDPAVNQGIFS